MNEVAKGIDAYFERQLAKATHSKGDMDELIAHIETAKAALETAQGTIERLTAERDAMAEALRFYADRAKYQHTGHSRYYPLAGDEGNVARAALTRADEQEKG